MKKLFVFILAACFIFGGFNGVIADDSVSGSIVYKSDSQILEKDINYVSEYALIGNPKEYDGKKVRLVGVLKYDINNSAIYVSSESLNMGITKNALWCSINPYTLKTNYVKLKELDGKFVMIEGVFNGLHTGHIDKYSGAVESISKIQLWNGK